MDEFRRPSPGPGEVLVRIRLASICGSDLHRIYDGLHEPERIGVAGYPGHEAVGEIVDSRAPGFAAGQWALVVPAGPVGGCFAEYIALDASQLVLLPDRPGPRRLLMAQQLGTTLFALERFLDGGQPGRSAVVIGAGSAGLFFVQLLRRRGFATVICAEPTPARRALAGRLGATTLIGSESLGDAVAGATDGAGADLVIEAAGYDTARADAIAVARAGGTVGCFGFPERPGVAPFPCRPPSARRCASSS